MKSENVPPANLSDSPKTAEARVALREYLQPPAVPDHVAAEERRKWAAKQYSSEIDERSVSAAAASSGLGGSRRVE